MRISDWSSDVCSSDLAADGASGTFNFSSGSSVCASTSAALTGVPVQAPFAVGVFPPPYSPTTCDGIGIERPDSKDISDEIRLIGNADKALNWQGGLYFMNITRSKEHGVGKRWFSTW